MSVFLDTTGQPTLGIGICDRCKTKYPLAELLIDKNRYGLRVCRDCQDEYDPWRLPARLPETVTLPFYRPDERIDTPGSNPGAFLFKGVGGNLFWDIEAGPPPLSFAPPIPPFVPQTPTDIILTNLTLIEQSFGAIVGTATAVDPTLPNTFETISVTNDPRFQVVMLDISSGTLELLPTQQVIFALEPTISLTLRTINSYGLHFDKNFVITVIQLPPPPQPPSSLLLNNTTIPEHVLAATVGVLTATDPNGPPSAQTMTVRNDARFEVVAIDSFNGTLKLKAGQQLDFATDPTVSLIVRTTNAFNLFLEHTYLITVIPTAHVPPTDITLDNLTVPDITFGAVVGTLTVTDPQLPGTTETLTVQNDARFQVVAIDSSHGTLKLKNTEELDHVAEPTINLTIRATNSFGLFLDKNFVISVVPAPTSRAHSSAFDPSFS